LNSSFATPVKTFKTMNYSVPTNDKCLFLGLFNKTS